MSVIFGSARERYSFLSMADPKIAEHKLSKQGQIFARASTTDEKIPDITPEYKGHGATRQEKEDENKAWISKDHTLANADVQNRDDSSRPQPDVYAQEVNKRLGALTSVMDKIPDGFETTKEKMSGTADETKNSTGVCPLLQCPYLSTCDLCAFHLVLVLRVHILL